MGKDIKEEKFKTSQIYTSVGVGVGNFNSIHLIKNKNLRNNNINIIKNTPLY